MDLKLGLAPGHTTCPQPEPIGYTPGQSRQLQKTLLPSAWAEGRWLLCLGCGLWVLPVAMWLVLGDLLANSKTKPHTLTSVTLHLVFALHEIIPF